MYYLQLEYNNRMISIPFGKIKDIDNYTMQFDNKFGFLDRIISVLGLNIDINDIGLMYLVEEKNKDLEFDYDYRKFLPIRYNRDNYNIDSLRDNFVLYLQKDHSRIKKYNIIHIGLSSMLDFKEGKRDLSDEEIRLAVYVYFKNNSKDFRNIYFSIKNECKIKIDPIKLSKEKIERDKLSKLECNENEYLQYLIELSSRNEEDRLRAMDELALLPDDELRKIMSKGVAGVVDGLSDTDVIRNNEILELELLVGMDIDDIRSLVLEKLGRRR